MKIVFVRHGQSLANIENRFTGWLDVDLTTKGYNQAYELGTKFRKINFKFEVCYTSMLKRAIKTAWGILDGLNTVYTPIIKSVYLNERHYGKLSGMNKLEGINKFGEKNLLSWLNEYEPSPPEMEKNFFKKLYNKHQYINVPMNEIPLTESLNDCLNRALKLWNNYIIQELKLEKNILIVAHSNILKVLIKKINKNINDREEIIPNTTPIVYEFDNKLKILKNYIII